MNIIVLLITEVFQINRNLKSKLPESWRKCVCSELGSLEK
jgi:hypothetical protein